MDKLNASRGKSRKLQDEIDELRIERDSLAKKANTAERYKQKLQATQDLQKQNAELQEELSEVRQQFNHADKARQQVAGLQLALEEYKRILPKIEQDRHELQMMKKQLEFDNAALAQRWERANEQHARDQESIANLTDKLGEFELSRNPTTVDSEGLDSELEESTRKEALLQVDLPAPNGRRLTTLGRRAKVAELETENQKLKAEVTLQESKTRALQQLLKDAEERQEERDRKNLEVYQEKLMLESSLAAIEQGDPIQGYVIQAAAEKDHANEIFRTEVFKKMRDQVGMEQKRAAGLEAELYDLRSQLHGVGIDGMLSERGCRKIAKSRSNSLSVPLPDQQGQSGEDVKKQHEEKPLTGQSHGITKEIDEKLLLRNAIDKMAATQDAESDDQVLRAILQELKRATTDRSSQQTEECKKDLDYQISLLSDKIMEGLERIAKKAEVRFYIVSSNPEPRQAYARPSWEVLAGADL